MTPSYRRPGQNRAAKPLVMAVQVILKCLQILVLTVCGPFMASAGYKDDIGYTALQSALGANMPDGRGVAVCQVEAVNNQSWMPDTGYSQFSGKTISDRTGNCPGTSPHATTVGTYFYGSDQSIAPAVTAINVYEATDWLLRRFSALREPAQRQADPAGLRHYAALDLVRAQPHRQPQLGGIGRRQSRIFEADGFCHCLRPFHPGRRRQHRNNPASAFQQRLQRHYRRPHGRSAPHGHGGGGRRLHGRPNLPVDCRAPFPAQLHNTGGGSRGSPAGADRSPGRN